MHIPVILTGFVIGGYATRKYGVSEIYAQVTSKYAVAYLENKSVKLTYEKKTDHIINRLGTDMCPMEEAVLNVNDAMMAKI